MMAVKYIVFPIVLSFSCFVGTAYSKLESSEENVETKSKSLRSFICDRMQSPIYSANTICSADHKCGFQLYDRLTGLATQPFVKYCECPEDSYCVKTDVNLNMQFFFYKCKENLDDEDEIMSNIFINVDSLGPGIGVHDCESIGIPKAKHHVADEPDLETNICQRSRVRRDHTEDIYSDGESSRETTTYNNNCEEWGKFCKSVSDSSIVESEQTEEDRFSCRN